MDTLVSLKEPSRFAMQLCMTVPFEPVRDAVTTFMFKRFHWDSIFNALDVPDQPQIFGKAALAMYVRHELEILEKTPHVVECQAANPRLITAAVAFGFVYSQKREQFFEVCVVLMRFKGRLSMRTSPHYSLVPHQYMHNYNVAHLHQPDLTFAQYIVRHPDFAATGITTENWSKYVLGIDRRTQVYTALERAYDSFHTGGL